MERVVGQPFETVMQERVLAPLGLADTTYFAHEAILHAAAAGHVQEPDGRPEVARPYAMPRRFNPCGGVISTVADLLRFAQFHLEDGVAEGKRVLGAEFAHQMRTVQTEADAGRRWGLGWTILDLGGTPVIGHNGATNGFTARLAVVPEHGFALAILANSDRGSAAHRGIAEEALARFCGLHDTPPAPVALPAGALDRFAGRYRTHTTDYTLTVAGERLRLDAVTTSPLNGRVTVREPAHLVPVGDRVFRVEDGENEGSLVDFILDANDGVRFYRTGGRLAYPAESED